MRYPVSKNGGSQDLGGSTPSPSSFARRHGRVWQGSALLTRGGERRPQVRVLLPPSTPRSSAEKSCGFRPHARPFDSGRGVHLTATSFNGRTTGCYPGDAGSNPAVAASRPDRLAVEDTGLSHRKRGFESRSGYFRTTRSRTRLGSGPAVYRVRRVRFPSRALLAVAQWMSAALLPRAMGVRLLPARLRRKACSEPSGCEPAERGAIPRRRPTESADREPATRAPRSREDP